MKTQRLAPVLLALALAGCGWKADGLARLEELYPTPKEPDAGAAGPIDIGTPQCSGFEGTWAVRLVQSGGIEPLGPPPWKMTLTDLFLAETSGRTVALTFCDQQVAIVANGQPTSLGKAQVPSGLRAALAAAPVRLSLPAGGAFEASDVVWLWGLRDVADPLTYALPTKDTWQADPHVFDQDGDGQPGVTMTILSPQGDRYMVRRAVWSFAPGRLTFDNQWITGALTSTVNEAALGATSALLLTPAPITMKAEGTVYQLRCVGRTYTCASLAVDHPELFRAAP